MADWRTEGEIEQCDKKVVGELLEPRGGKKWDGAKVFPASDHKTRAARRQRR